MDQTRRVLLIRLGGLGDVVFTLPAVNAVKAAFPEARFTFLIYTEFASLLQGFPPLDSVITLDRSRYRSFKAVFGEVFRMLHQLRRGKFDLIVDFQGFGETGLLSRWTGAPERWGIVYRPSRGWAYTSKVPRDPNLHPIDFQLELVRRSGGISLNQPSNKFIVPESAVAKARLLFQEWGLDAARPTLFIQPFTNGELKNWRLTDYIGIAKLWKERALQVVFGGGPAEREVLEPARRAGFPVAAGTPLLLSAGLVGLSTVILGGDTGLLHLAAAMGKRVVMIINSTHPGKCFPYGHADWAVVPDDGENIASVKSEVVLEACYRALMESDRPHPLGPDRWDGSKTAAK